MVEEESTVQDLQDENDTLIEENESLEARIKDLESELNLHTELYNNERRRANELDIKMNESDDFENLSQKTGSPDAYLSSVLPGDDDNRSQFSYATSIASEQVAILETQVELEKKTASDAAESLVQITNQTERRIEDLEDDRARIEEQVGFWKGYWLHCWMRETTNIQEADLVARISVWRCKIKDAKLTEVHNLINVRKHADQAELTAKLADMKKALAKLEETERNLAEAKLGLARVDEMEKALAEVKCAAQRKQEEDARKAIKLERSLAEQQKKGAELEEQLRKHGNRNPEFTLPAEENSSSRRACCGW